MKPLERVGICCADSSESFWWDAGQQPHCPGCPIDSETYEEDHEFFVVEARLGRAAAQLQKLYDLAGIAHHRILSSEQGLDEESKRLGNALAATRDLLASWEGEPYTLRQLRRDVKKATRPGVHLDTSDPDWRDKDPDRHVGEGEPRT